MSQASRSKVAARLRHRGQVAGFIKEVSRKIRFGRHTTHHTAWDGSGRRPIPVTSFECFDVHAVREAAKSMRDEARGYGRVFEGWARSLKMGPDGFSGWPGLLAHHPRCPTPSWAPMWRWRVRLAQRVLAALEGQPSECTLCLRGRATPGAWPEPGRCPECQGTGHNLRGRLPPLRPSAQLCRRRADQGVDGFTGLRTTGPTWLDDPEITGYMAPGWGLRPTRVAPRGEHRRCADEPVTPRSRVRGYGPYRWAPGSTCSRGGADPWSRVPRWRRGELRHAEQRRAKA